MMYFWNIIGAVILAAAIAWAILHNHQSRRGKQRTEEATRELYKDPLDHETTRESKD
jgi:formate/nitrite transporter FocA (FNT family)